VTLSFGLVYLFVLDFPAISGIFFLLSFVFLFSHFRYGPIIFAFGEATRGRFTSANEYLSTVDASRLSTTKRAYFFLTRGLVDEANNDLTAAESSYAKALYEGVLPDKEIALARLGLARIAHLQGKDDLAVEYLERLDRSAIPRSLLSEIELLGTSVQVRNQPDPKPVGLFDNVDTGRKQ
jgi:hypothetical protein